MNLKLDVMVMPWRRLWLALLAFILIASPFVMLSLVDREIGLAFLQLAGIYGLGLSLYYLVSTDLFNGLRVRAQNSRTPRLASVVLYGSVGLVVILFLVLVAPIVIALL